MGDRVLVPNLCGEVYIVGKDVKQSSAPDCVYGQEFRVVRCHEILGVIE